MQITVRVKPNAKTEKVEKASDGAFLLWVRAPAKENKANTAAVKLLSKFFDRPKNSIIIVKGEKSKNKIVDIS